MAEINLSKYGISDVKEIVYNPSYELLFAEETKPEGTTEGRNEARDETLRERRASG